MRLLLSTAVLAFLINNPVPAADAPASAPVFGLTVDDVATKPALALVAEMDLVPEVDGWTAAEPGAAGADAAGGFKAEWAKVAPWVGTKVTPAVARALSRWAAKQMETYQAVPPFDKLAFTPVATLKARGLIVYEAKVDRLPAHSPLVTRHLIAYVCYDPEAKSIKRVTITIRGHVEE
jgi:hypothetical protein